MFIQYFRQINKLPFHCIRSLRNCLCFFLFSLPAWGAPTILVVGDSLSSAHLISVEAGWVKLMEHKIKQIHPDWIVINASISGDTTAGGLQRLPGLLERYRPTIVILELGGNDGLRGQPLLNIEKNLKALIEKSLAIHAKVLLVGIQLPPNYGTKYTKEFAEIYPRLSKKYDLPLVPFLLEGIPWNAEMIFEDDIHPRAQAQPIIANNVLTYLLPLL